MPSRGGRTRPLLLAPRSIAPVRRDGSQQLAARRTLARRRPCSAGPPCPGLAPPPPASPHPCRPSPQPRSGPARRRVGHLSSQLGPSRRRHRWRRCRLPRRRDWRLRRARGWLAARLRGRRRSLRRALNGRACGPELAWRSRLQRRSRRGGGRPGRLRGALDSGGLSRRGGGTAFAGAAPGFPAAGEVSAEGAEATGAAGSCDPYLPSISAIAASSARSSRVMSLSGSGGRKLLSCSSSALRARP